MTRNLNQVDHFNLRVDNLPLQVVDSLSTLVAGLKVKIIA